MNEIWDAFLLEFCKVEFVCHSGEPNWLGWVAMSVGGIVALYIALAILGSILGGLFS